MSSDPSCRPSGGGTGKESGEQKDVSFRVIALSRTGDVASAVVEEGRSRPGVRRRRKILKYNKKKFFFSRNFMEF